MIRNQKVDFGKLRTYKTNQWGEVKWRNLRKKVREGTDIGEELVKVRVMIHRERYRLFICIYYLWHNSVHTSTCLTEQASQFIWFDGLFLQTIL